MPTPPDLLAVLIDADNISASRIGPVLLEIASFGTASVKRVYGDWTSTSLRTWKDAASAHVIQPIQQFANTTGKDATDSALIIDAMDLLYTGRFSGFCIVSSDSDFTRLASRIREDGLTVHGFGERKTPESFRNACDRFTYVDLIGNDPIDGPVASAAPRRRPRSELRADAKLVSALRASVESASVDTGWAHLSTVGSMLRKQQPDFDARDWGYTKLSDLVVATDLFTMEQLPVGGFQVRAKQAGAAAPGP